MLRPSVILLIFSLIGALTSGTASGHSSAGRRAECARRAKTRSAWDRRYHPAVPAMDVYTPLRGQAKLLRAGSPLVVAASKDIGLWIRWLYPITAKDRCLLERHWVGGYDRQRERVIRGVNVRSTRYPPGLYLGVPDTSQLPLTYGPTEYNPDSWIVVRRGADGKFRKIDQRDFAGCGWADVCLLDANADGLLDAIVSTPACDPGGAVQAFTILQTGRLQVMKFSGAASPDGIRSNEIADSADYAVPGDMSLVNLDSDPDFEIVVADWWRTWNRGYQFREVFKFDHRSKEWVERGKDFPQITADQTAFYAAYDAACAKLLAERKASGKTIDELMGHSDVLLTWHGKPYDLEPEANFELMEAMTEDEQRTAPAGH